jgi:hypothetical protein
MGAVARLCSLRIAVLVALAVAGCGSRTELNVGLNVDEAQTDAGAAPTGCILDDGCGAAEVCGNGVDDNCSDGIDEGCPCTPGAVQPCFVGPPARRGVGACRDGAQTCGIDGTWGVCSGGIGPREDICNGQDNLCNGCSQQRDCPILCPSPGDPRVPDGAPFQDYALRGRDFYVGPVRSWQWSVRGGPCDALTPTRPSFDVRNPMSFEATFFPRLSGDYTITLDVVTYGGLPLSCTWITHVEGPGLRVEMCYPENMMNDLDLFVHDPRNRDPWYATGATTFEALPTSCGWHNCEASIRGKDLTSGALLPRANWGYPNSPLTECSNGPLGSAWRALGFCANPRLDIDNNLEEGKGVPENINIDDPRDGETFRIMVQNFTGTASHPLVNVYCSGRRVATYGQPPSEVQNFQGTPGRDAIGAMWRPADVRVQVAPDGRTTGCDVQPLHPPGSTQGYWITQNDPRY